MTPPTPEPAPAKINLALHVTGRRDDGYHLLDSLVVFTALGDRVTVAPGPLSLRLTGPFADAVPGGEDNLVMRAARAVGAGAAITLDKHLPPASGIGGGTADAAAVSKALHGMSYQGVAGTYGYDAAGNLKKTAVTVYTFKGGALSPLASY